MLKSTTCHDAMIPEIASGKRARSKIWKRYQSASSAWSATSLVAMTSTSWFCPDSTVKSFWIEPVAVLGDDRVVAFGEHHRGEGADDLAHRVAGIGQIDQDVSAIASPPGSRTSFMVSSAAWCSTVASVSLPASTRMSERMTALTEP